MGTFDFHDEDVRELLGGDLAAFGVWIYCGTWTSAHGRKPLVPADVAEEIDPDGLGARALVAAGLWEPTTGGYRMLRGPSSDPDLPLPVWRYGDVDLGGRPFAVDDTPNT